MEKYIPPFSISNKMLEYVSGISEKVGSINNYDVFRTKPYLRRNNRIESIHSSLKIEANSLSLSEVRDVIDGNLVIGDEIEIQEVKNAYEAYSKINDVDPFSISDLKLLHSIMTYRTVAESGDFRKGEEGVFDGDRCIFVAPPPNMVNELVENLFTWMKENENTIHPLIMAAVFHYEFVFIHPFSDGNGRIARLWHNVILYRWRKIFEYIPLESQIVKFQSEYYKSISKCHKNGNSDVFIEFILERIDCILDEFIIAVNKKNLGTNEYMNRLLNIMEYDIEYKALELMDKLGLKSRETFRKHYLNPAMELGVVRMTIPDKPNSRNQRYVRKY